MRHQASTESWRARARCVLAGLVGVFGAGGAAGAGDGWPVAVVVEHALYDVSEIEQALARLQKGDARGLEAVRARCEAARRTLTDVAADGDAAWADALVASNAVARRLGVPVTGSDHADAPLERARVLLDHLERAAKAVGPREGGRAAALLGELEVARALACGSAARGGDAWARALARANTLRRLVLVRHAALPPPGPWEHPSAGERPPPSSPPLSADDAEVLAAEFFPAWDGAVAALEQVFLERTSHQLVGQELDDRVGAMRGTLVRLTARAHPDAEWCRRRLRTFEDLLAQSRREDARGAAARRAGSLTLRRDLTRRLPEILAHFDPEALEADLVSPPLDRAGFDAWLVRLMQWESLVAAASSELAVLRAGQPGLTDDPALSTLAERLDRVLPGALARARADVLGAPAGAGHTLQGGRLRAIFEAGCAAATERGGGSLSVVAGRLAALRAGANAGESLAHCLLESFPEASVEGLDLLARAQRLHGVADHQEVAPPHLAARTRFPPPATTSVELERAAWACLGTKDAPPLLERRLVVTSLPRREPVVIREGYAESDGVRLLKLEAVRETFQAVTTRQVRGHLRLIHCTFERWDVSNRLNWSPHWSLVERREAERIHPEHVWR